jgi:hypothetical protein
VVLNFGLAIRLLAIASSRTRQEELLMHISILRQAVGARAPRSRAAVPILNVIDDFNSGSLGSSRLQGLRVVRELKLVVAIRGRRAMIASDDGTELASDTVLCWAAEHKIEWHCIAQNAFV